MKTMILISLLAILTTHGFAADDAVKATGAKDIKTSAGCTIERYTIYSPSMKKDVKIAVVLPPEYAANPNKKYPIVYTLHGARAPYDTYANMLRFHEALGTMPMIYTCFEAEMSRYLDAPAKPEYQYQTFFFDEFIPFIDAAYRTNGQRGVTGFSMGGFGATLYTLMHPEMFVAACGLSSTFTNFADKAGLRRIPSLLGDPETYPQRYEAVDTYALLRKHVAAGVKLPALLYACGTEDRLLGASRGFRDLMVELNAQMSKAEYDKLTDVPEGRQRRRAVAKLMDGKRINFRYIEQPGGHNWTYWHGQAPEFARFFWQEFQKDAKSKQ